MDKNKPSPYIEHVFRCSLTGRDPDPDAKRYEKWELWDEIINAHINGMNAVLRISREAETAMRAKARENNNIDSNKNRKEEEQ
jgi:hypothetical protein